MNSNTEMTAGDRLQQEMQARIEAHRHEARMITAAAVDGALMVGGHLRAAPHDVHDTADWYKACSSRDLAEAGYPVSPSELAFPVPPECPAWYDAEPDHRDGRLMRFFLGTAWLDLPESPAQAYLVVHYAVTGEAQAGLCVEVDGERISSRGQVDDLGREIVPLPIGGRRLKVSCPVVAVPADLDPASTDVRRLSAAISVQLPAEELA